MTLTVYAARGLPRFPLPPSRIDVPLAEDSDAFMTGEAEALGLRCGLGDWLRYAGREGGEAEAERPRETSGGGDEEEIENGGRAAADDGKGRGRLEEERAAGNAVSVDCRTAPHISQHRARG